MKNPYKVLGIEKDATQEEITAAYKELMGKHQQIDENSEDPADASENEAVKEIEEAYAALAEENGEDEEPSSDEDAEVPSAADEEEPADAEPEALSDTETEVLSDTVTETPSEEETLSGSAIEGALPESAAETAAPKNNRTRNIIILIIIVVAAVVCCIIFLPNLNAGSGSGSNSSLVAKVGDTEISHELVDNLSAFLLYTTYGEKLSDLAEDEQQIIKNQILTTYVVQSEMIKEKLKSEGIEGLSEEDLALVQEDTDYVYSDEEFSGMLTEMGVTRADIEYAYEAQLYYQKYREVYIAENPITDEDVDEFYEANKQYFVQAEQWRASHILIMDAEHTDEKRAEAEEILEKARNGEDFAELAIEYSEDTSAADGGDLGYFDETVSFVDAFREAVFALEVDEISDVVETEYGYHIIKLTEYQEAYTTPKEEMEADIISYLEDEYTSLAIIELKNEIPVEYYIEVDPETGEPPVTLPAEDTTTGSADEAVIDEEYTYDEEAALESVG